MVRRKWSLTSTEIEYAFLKMIRDEMLSFNRALPDNKMTHMMVRRLNHCLDDLMCDIADEEIEWLNRMNVRCDVEVSSR